MEQTQILSGYRHWEELESENSVGLITTLLSEQILSQSLNTHSISFENYIEDIELYDIDTVFIDNDLYENDHEWYKKNRGFIINYLKNNGINLVVIKNTTLEVNSVFKNAFLMQLNPDIDDYQLANGILNLPLLVNTDAYNPINSHKNIDVLYFSVGKLKASPQIKLYNKTFDPEFKVISEGNLSRRLTKKLFSFAKNSKVLYICESAKLDAITLKFIEVIAYLSSTNVIYDYTYNFNPKYGYNSRDDKNNVSKLRILIKSDVYCMKQVLYNQRQALNYNTFLMNTSLLEYITLGKSKKVIPQVSVITSTNRKENLDFYFNQMNQQKEVDIEINLVTHGFQLTSEELKHYKSLSNYPVKIHFMEQNNSLGVCLNKCVESSTHSVMAKVDDDDFYLDYYLFDQWLALKYSYAEVVGKSEGYYYFEKDDVISRRNTGRFYKFDHFIMGATIMIKSEMMKELMFSDIPKAVDTDLLRRVGELNGKIYIGHPFEMCVFRSANLEGHTWKVNDLMMLKSSEIVSFGDPKSYVKLNQTT